MGVDIHTIKLGVENCYVIRSDGAIMINAGGHRQAARFRKAMAARQIEPRSIRLIVITHGHWDHIGSAKDIKEITGAKLAMHQREKDWLEKAMLVHPPGANTWGRILKAITEAFVMPLSHFPATNVDVVLGDEGLSLAGYGIPGRVIYTPGHSMGSVSVLLDTGDAFVGDLAMNRFPLRLSPGLPLPVFAENLQVLKNSWRRLLDLGAKTVYPAHGKPFSAEVIRKSLL